MVEGIKGYKSEREKKKTTEEIKKKKSRAEYLLFISLVSGVIYCLQ